MSPIPNGSWTILAIATPSTSGPSKASATWETVPEMSVSVTPDVPILGVLFEGTFLLAPSSLGSTVQGQIRFSVNGSPVAGTVRTLRMQAPASLLAITPGDAHVNVNFPTTLEVVPGTPITIAAEWSVTGQTLTAVGLERGLYVRRIE